MKLLRGLIEGRERRLNLQKSLIKRVPFIFIKLTQTQPSAPPEASCVNMQWTVTTIIPLVSVILTAVIAPLGWVIQRYWNTKSESSPSCLLVPDPNSAL